MVVFINDMRKNNTAIKYSKSSYTFYGFLGNARVIWLTKPNFLDTIQGILS